MTRKKNRSKKWIMILLVLIIIIPPWLWWQNNGLMVTRHTVQTKTVSPDLDGTRIVHLSDLQSKWYGNRQKSLSDKVAGLEPDLIVFSGDLMDANHYDEEAGLTLMEQLVDIAPVYFVSGNHEHWAGTWAQVKDKLVDLGVHVVDGTSLTPEKYPDLRIFGLEDPVGTGMNDFIATRQAFTLYGDQFNILLAHRPELNHLYEGFDLVFAGHAHGGQVRLPFIGGVIAPNQGFFPEFTEGLHQVGDTCLVISRGLGNSIAPVRIFNRPEIVVIDLRSQ